jgi:ATP-binding cassette subfamily A (ABC1) protein 3
MSRIASNFDSRQHHALQHVESPDDIAPACPQNFNLFSECFGAVVFNALPQSAEDPTSVNYTIRADGGLYHIDVTGGKSDFEKRILPLQFALDQVRSECDLVSVI